MRESLGELPAALRARLEATYGITPTTATCWSTRAEPLVDYFVELAQPGRRRQAGQQLDAAGRAAHIERRNATIDQFPISAPALAELIERVRRGDLDTSRGREVFAEMLTSGKSAAEVIAARGIARVDESELIVICQEVVAANPKIVADIKAGKQQAAGNLVGQVKKRNPNVNPAHVREICIEIAEKL